MLSFKIFAQTIGILIGFTLGFSSIYIVVSQVIKSEQAKKWSIVTASIEHVDMEVDEYTDRETNKTTPTYLVTPDYSYVWEGKKYTGSKISFLYKESANYKYHSKIFDILKSTDKISLRVNPQKPEQAVIVSGYIKSNGTLIIVVVTALILLFIFSVIRFKYPPSMYLLDSIQTGIISAVVIILIYVIYNWKNGDIIKKIEIVSLNS